VILRFGDLAIENLKARLNVFKLPNRPMAQSPNGSRFGYLQVRGCAVLIRALSGAGK
jgi:hypothetical protein